MPDILDRLNQLIPTISGPQIVELMRKHDISIDQVTALKNHPDKLAYVESMLLKEDEQKAWQSIQPQIASPNPAAKAAIEPYIAKWAPYDFAKEHIDKARNAIRAIDQAIDDQEWAYVLTQITPPTPSAIDILQKYIDKWENRSPMGAHVFEARQKLDEIKAGLQQTLLDQEQREWDALAFTHNINEIVNHVNKWHANGIDTHLNDADERAWQITQASPDRIGAIREYLRLFGQGSKHYFEANDAINMYDTWMNVKGSRDLLAVHRFIDSYPNCIFVNDAKLLRNELKAVEIQRMKSEQDNYPVDYLLGLIQEGVFSDNELMAEGVATTQSLEMLRNLIGRRDTLPSLIDVQGRCTTYCAPDRTDVYLFGTPATGKTCILMGLIGSGYINTNFVESAGEYASALELYMRNGFTPGQTVRGFVATVQATIKHKDNSHEINLVELAGEDFALNVAAAKDGVIDFAQMGAGVPELLSNDNRKVFFIIVDPTSKTLNVTLTKPLLDADGNPMLDEFGQPRSYLERFTIDQKQSLLKMINMLQSPVNKKVMEKVDAIHVIMTKGDKLGNLIDRDDKAYDLFMKSYKSIISPLTELCRQYGINQHPKKELNGVPRLFTFSLGKFYPGGLYEYDDTDANVLVETIARCTGGTRPTTVWDRFCQAMTRPII